MNPGLDILKDGHKGREDTNIFCSRHGESKFNHMILSKKKLKEAKESSGCVLARSRGGGGRASGRRYSGPEDSFIIKSLIILCSTCMSLRPK
jgi:hypothetical protein